MSSEDRRADSTVSKLISRAAAAYVGNSAQQELRGL